jgi:hypothetical protein
MGKLGQTGTHRFRASAGLSPIVIPSEAQRSRGIQPRYLKGFMPGSLDFRSG